MKNQRSVLKACIVATLVFLGTLGASAQQEEYTMRVGVIPLVEHIPLLLAQKEIAATVTKEKVQLDVYNSWTALEAAFRTGAIDAAAITLPKALLMAYEGVPLKILLVVGRNGSTIVLNNDSADALKGKITGGSGNDTMDLLVFARFLKEKKLRLGRDVRYLLIPFSRTIALMKEERIYGFCLSEPYGALAEKEAVAKRVILSKDIYPNLINSVLIVNPQTLKNHPDVIKLFVKELTKAAAFIEKDKDASNGAQTAMAQVNIFKINPEVVKRALTMPKDRILFKNLVPQAQEIENVEKDLMGLNVLSGMVKLNDIIDTRFCD
ncbi:MAG: ABC transporter substrate-binding protein [Candidatus Omnitrophota bacterium]|jgi:NitT/TauT family transport system substrate-binding protein